MMEDFPLLSKLLVHLRSSKRKKEFIKYISTMNYDDFRSIWVHYTDVLFKKITKYQNSNFFSRNWFKHKSAKIYYSELYILFTNANPEYINRVQKEFENFADKVLKIIQVINERQAVLENIKKIDLTSKENAGNKILIILTIMEGIYSQEELIKAIEKLKKLKRFK